MTWSKVTAVMTQGLSGYYHPTITVRCYVPTAIIVRASGQAFKVSSEVDRYGVGLSLHVTARRSTNTSKIGCSRMVDHFMSISGADTFQRLFPLVEEIAHHQPHGIAGDVPRVKGTPKSLMGPVVLAHFRDYPTIQMPKKERSGVCANQARLRGILWVPATPHDDVETGGNTRSDRVVGQKSPYSCHVERGA